MTRERSQNEDSRGGGPIIRRMLTRDIDQVYEIEKESFPAPWTREAFYQELTYNDYAYYLVIEDNGLILAYGGMWCVADEGHITNIAVRKAYRGLGYGKAIMQALKAAAYAQGLKKMTLEVRVSNHIGQALYEKMGFRPVSVRKRYYSDNQEDAIVMLAELGEPYEWGETGE